MHTTPSILFLCESESTAVSEFLPLSVWLQQQGMKPILVLAKNNFSLEETIREKGISYLVIDKSGAYYSEDQKPRRHEEDSLQEEEGSLFRRLPFIKALYGIYSQIYTKRVQKKVCIKALQQLNAKIIVTYHEGNFLLVPEIVTAAKQIGVKIVRQQMTRSPISFLVGTRLKKGNKFIVNNFSKRLYAALLPHHVQEAAGKKIVFYTPVQAFVLWVSAMLPRRPWHNGDSYADDNFLMSSFHLEQEREEGWYLKNSRIVGQFSLDALYEGYSQKKVKRENIFSRYFPSENQDKPLVIVALPQLYEHKILSKDDALSSISHLIKVFEDITAANFLISLHPKMDRNLYHPLLQKGSNCAIADERLNEVLPAGDILISAFESVISWGILCDVRPVLLDYYSLGFNGALYQSCTILRDQASLKDDLERLIGADQGHYEALMRRDKSALLPFDGKAGMRIRQAFEEMIGE